MTSRDNIFERHERDKRSREKEERLRAAREKSAEEERLRLEQRKAQEKAQEEEKRIRRHFTQATDSVVRQFDSTIKQILRDYGDAKMKGFFRIKRIEGPEIGYSSVSWALRCIGYEGVEITLHFEQNDLDEWRPTMFTISGIHGGRSRAGVSVDDLVEALLDSYPSRYEPPTPPSEPIRECGMGTF